MTKSVLEQYVNLSDITHKPNDFLIDSDTVKIPVHKTQFIASNGAQKVSEQYGVPLLAIKIDMELNNRYTSAGIGIRDVRTYKYKYQPIK
jgi:hypothetical protein